jgi:hypothetical protein
MSSCSCSLQRIGISDRLGAFAKVLVAANLHMKTWTQTKMNWNFSPTVVTSVPIPRLGRTLWITNIFIQTPNHPSITFEVYLRRPEYMGVEKDCNQQILKRLIQAVGKPYEKPSYEAMYMTSAAFLLKSGEPAEDAMMKAAKAIFCAFGIKRSGSHSTWDFDMPRYTWDRKRSGGEFQWVKRSAVLAQRHGLHA